MLYYELSIHITFGKKTLKIIWNDYTCEKILDINCNFI